jgi:hypothetical protein
VPLLYVPGELLVSIRHATPDPWAGLPGLTAALSGALPPDLALIAPTPPAQLLAGRLASPAPTAAGRGAHHGWTFRPAAPQPEAAQPPAGAGLHHTVLRYRLAPAATDTLTASDGTDPDHIVRAATAITTGVASLNAMLRQSGNSAGQISSATPNWALSGEPSGIIVGGPGGPPAPEDNLTGAGTAAEGGAGTRGWHVTFPDLPENHPARATAGATARVLVVVLDTSPTQQEVDAAALRYPGNRLLGEMASGGAHPVEAWEDALGDCAYRATRVPGREYVMRDHGLFVAGIIRDIAPACALRVVRILNDWGGGCLSDLIAGLEYVHDLAAVHDGPIVVNLSLTAKVPVHAELPALYPVPLAHTPREASAPLLEIIRDLSSRSDSPHPILFVAAAGNDSGDRGDHPLEPRVPAVYDSTLGVAALDATGKRAEYSNRGDTTGPFDNGIATYGGAAGVAPSGAGPIDALRGLFSAPAFPPTPGTAVPNTTGWARWAGTSFATAVISGLAANLLARSPSLPPAAVMRELRNGAKQPPDSTINCLAIAAVQQRV